MNVNARGEPECEWCQGRGIVTVRHVEFNGTHPFYIERTTKKGEVVKVREKATIAVFCDECRLGKWMISNQKPERNERITTTADVFAQRIPYTFLEESPAVFKDWSEAVQWMRSLGSSPVKSVLKTFPRAPKPARPQTPMDVANALRERTEKEGAA